MKNLSPESVERLRRRCARVPAAPDGLALTPQGRLIPQARLDVQRCVEAIFRRHRTVGRVYQNPALGTCPSMTLLENMSLADTKGRPFNLRRGTDRRRIAFYREQLSRLNLGLEDKLHVKVGSLSGGQRQAAALLMSTMTPIDFLILDEHTAALDPKTAERIMELTDQIVREKKLTTIMVTHNLRYAVEYGDRLVMMHEGQVIRDLRGEAKKRTQVQDLLDTFYEISVESGNGV